MSFSVFVTMLVIPNEYIFKTIGTMETQLLRTISDIEIRAHAPERREDNLKGVLYANQEFVLTFEKVTGDWGNIEQTNNTWYKDQNGDFLWSGGFAIVPSDEIVIQRIDYVEYSQLQDDNLQWWHKSLRLNEIWSNYFSSELHSYQKVKVAVLDTGIRKTHQFLKNNIVHYEDVTQSSMNDNIGHGTHLSGLITGQPTNIGCIGINPFVDLYVYKIIHDNRGQDVDYLIEAIEKAITQQVEVICICIGFYHADVRVAEVLERAKERGIIVISAAGNNEPGIELEDVLYPAKYDSCIAVGAIDSQFLSQGISVLSPHIDIVAPGIDVLSAYHQFDTDCKSLNGTSMAAAIITGIVALGISLSGRLYSTDEVRAKLQQSADDTLSEFTCGFVNPKKYLEVL